MFSTRSPCGILPQRSAKKEKRKPCAEAGVFPIRPDLNDVTIIGGSSAQPRQFIISQLKPPSKATAGQIRKPASTGTQQLLPLGQSWKALQHKAAKSTAVADTTIIKNNPPTSAVKVHNKRRSFTCAGNRQSKMKSRIPIPVKQRRVDPREMEKLEEQEEDLMNNLTRVRGRLQHLKTLIVFRRPPLIAQRQLQAVIRTNSGASSAAPDAPAQVSSPSAVKPKRRRSRSLGSIPPITFKTRIPVMVKTGPALADPKEVAKLEKEERELEKQLNRVRETIQSLKAPIIIRKPMKRVSLDKQTNQLEGATAFSPKVSTSFLNARLPLEVVSAEDESFKINNPPPPDTPSADDAFHSDSSQSGSPALRYFSKVENFVGKVEESSEIPIAPFSPDLFLDASKTKSPTSIYKHLRKRTGTLLATPTKPSPSTPASVRRSARLMSRSSVASPSELEPSTPSSVRRSARLMSGKKSLLYAAHMNSTSKRVQFQLESLFAPDQVKK